MNLTWKRNWKYVLIFILIILAGILFGSTRNMSYNFGTYTTELSYSGNTISGNSEILDESFVHSVDISLTQEQYEYILNSYTENAEKEFVSVNVTIDGTTIENVGLRLKGNLDLVMLLSNPGVTETPGFIASSYLLKFDEYTAGQNYEGYSELALRYDSEASNLGQMLSNAITRNLGLYAPETVYTTLKIGDFGSYFYILSQVVDETYLTENFEDSSGVLYEAENSLSFHYLGEDPVSYIDLFTQETNKNNDDMSSMIELLKFVSTSSDEDFSQKLSEYIDIDSYAGFLALDTILGEDDELLGLLNNYYIYFDPDSGKASFIFWDQKISFGSIPPSLQEILLKYYGVSTLSEISEDDISSLVNFTTNGVQGETTGETTGKYQNDLKIRFLENEDFVASYNQKLAEYKNEIFSQGLASQILVKLETVFLSSSQAVTIVGQNAFTSEYASYWNVFQNLSTQSLSGLRKLLRSYYF